MKMDTPVSSNFFERQDKARRTTSWLVIAFVLGILGTATAIYFAIMIFIFGAGGSGDLDSVVNLEIAAGTLAGTLLVVGGASLFKSLEMSNFTGADVARELNGKEVSAGTSDPAERRLLNIVQEMSLASGVPMPSVFILYGEDSINAFAAGTKFENAAIAVSRGALMKLSRDELQGVIGHEFSHILNGDMRLNIKLIGWIFGLLAVSLLGSILIRSSALSASSSRKKNGGGIIIFGIAVYLIGIIAQFFGRIIQAAISRQREHLADASSTQFTRNPLALANALSRIGGDSAGSRISAPRATEYAHLFFADGIGALFATHPPLEERIRLLNPAWNGNFLPPLSQRFEVEEISKSVPANGKSVPAETVACPAFIRELAGTVTGSRALIILLMMSDNQRDDSAQAQMLLRTESRSFFETLKSSWEKVGELQPAERIPAAVLAAKTLQALPPREKNALWNTLRKLAEIDGNVSAFEQGLLSTFRDTVGV